MGKVFNTCAVASVQILTLAETRLHTAALYDPECLTSALRTLLYETSILGLRDVGLLRFLGDVSVCINTNVPSWFHILQILSIYLLDPYPAKSFSNMLFVLYSLLCLAITSYATPILHDRAADPTVTLDSGIVVGTATRVQNQPSVTGLANAYLGVPFASSPPLRFAPATPPKPWAEPLVAQNLPPACLQSFGSGAAAARTKEYFNNPGYAPPQESEDCLYLNVFTPPDASPTNLKPVLFWLFGVSRGCR